MRFLYISRLVTDYLISFCLFLSYIMETVGDRSLGMVSKALKLNFMIEKGPLEAWKLGFRPWGFIFCPYKNGQIWPDWANNEPPAVQEPNFYACLLYTSDAADE